jgi:hypothetical protein
MPVGLSQAAAPTTKSKSIEIFTSYPNLSTLNWPAKADRHGGLSPLTNRRLFSARPSQSSRRIELRLRLGYGRNGKQYHRDQDWHRSFLHLRLIREFI